MGERGGGREWQSLGTKRRDLSLFEVETKRGGFCLDNVECS